MLINSCNYKKRLKILTSKYLKLLEKNVPSDEILVLTQNSKKKKEFIEIIKNKHPQGSIGELKIYSFSGLCYNMILDNWAIVENSIKNENAVISPHLSGLEVSQYIFKKCVEDVEFKGYNSKINLLHQMLRRYSLITLNNLSDDEVKKRSDILAENFAPEANCAINKYKLKTIENRAFDYIRQIDIFEFLYKKIKNPFKYVFLDDGDEITPAVLAYLEYIKPTVKEFFIGYDYLGSSRLGYLGAINVNYEKFLAESAIRDSKNTKKFIFDYAKENKPIEADFIKTKTFLKRDEMIDDTVKDIKSLLKKGVKPCEIAIITPLSDEFLKSALNKTGLYFNFISKNEKLNQNKLIAYILELLKIINDTKNLDISPYNLKGILIELLGFDKIETIKLIQQYKLEKNFKNCSFFDFLTSKNLFKELLELYEKIKFLPLSKQLYEIVSKFVPLVRENSKNIIKINQLLKQISDFEDVFKNQVSNFELLIQLENTIISENPLSDVEINRDEILVSTAQKIIDYSYDTKYQFLLDCSHCDWIKQDIGPLYNAWVMQKKWSKDVYELNDNIELTKDKVIRGLYKLFCLGENITLYSSVYDSLGIENFSGIDKYFKYENKKETLNITKIIPRKDQKEVLNYNGGLMSISATAGSGKTTILLLLVEKLLSGEILSNIEAKNIFVLTFMESAARNFRERIKAKYPDLAELPNISTIHGLALRIIKENNNYSYLGLDYDFEIVDDIKRASILNEVLILNNISFDKSELYDRAISAYKNELSLYDNYKTQNKLFLNVYNEYQKKLKEQNLIDYDDLLLYSLKLLKENKDILNYYQDLAHVIIEDEAQDSSYVQQSLIKLLGAKHNNIIRCGDINQAITSTFTNSDPKGFKDFMTQSLNVVMDRCQRCATGVLDCANNTVEYSKLNHIEAFSDLVMKPVEDKNIVDKNAVEFEIFDVEKDEKKFITKKIKEILKEDKNATIAILLRSNFAIENYVNLMKENSIKTYRNSDSLINNSLYRVVVLILEFIKDPYDLKIVCDIAKELYELGYYTIQSFNYAQNLKEPLFLASDFDEPLYWDLTYFLFKNHSSIYDLVYEIGEFYFSRSSQKANIPLIAAMAQKISQSAKTFENTVLKLREIQHKLNFSNIKFYSLEDNTQKASYTQVMTLHKSKGDEFDYVFIPELTQENLCLSKDELKLKENTKFIQKVKYMPKSDDELKKEIIEENLRLIYVGITRAKKKLYLSCAQKYKYFAKMKETKPTQLFEGLEEIWLKNQK